MSSVGCLLRLLCLFLSIVLSQCLSEREALLAFKNSLSNASQILPSWNANSDPCTAKWHGVFCVKGRVHGSLFVIRLHLQNLGLSGSSIDIDTLSELQYLHSFSISKNAFDGPLPAFNKLKGLKAIYLDSNKFSGEIPGNYFYGTNLRRIWFSNNEFSGKIPESLGKLSGLTALHLEGNKFSGEIPDISQKFLTELDLSGNQLEGKVPESMERFGPKPFERNFGICWESAGMKCKEVGATAEAGARAGAPPGADAPKQLLNSPNHTAGTIVFTVALVAIVFILLLISIHIRRMENKEIHNRNNSHRGGLVIVRKDDSSNNKNNNNNEVVGVDVEVCIHGNGVNPHSGEVSSRKSTDSSSSNKKGGGSHNGSGKGSKKETSDLTVINDEKSVFGLADLMKAEAELLGNTGLGSSYKVMMSNGVAVVVKRIRNTNQLEKQEFHAEIRKLGKLNHKNILTPLAYHYRKEEKLLVSEYISKGSLLYVLHGDRGNNHAELNWATRLNIIKGITYGMSYLHNELCSYELPHGNLKSSNVLLDNNYEPKLSDYGFYRIFPSSEASQGMFAYQAPESVQKQQISSKCDVYCLGVIILEVLMGKFPSQYNNAGKGGTDVVQWVWSSIEEEKEADILDPEITSSTNSLEAMIQLLHIGAVCCDSDPNERPNLEEVITRVEEIEP